MTEGWEEPRDGDRSARRTVHYMRLGVSACGRLGNWRRPVTGLTPAAGARLCRDCERELARELAERKQEGNDDLPDNRPGD